MIPFVHFKFFCDPIATHHHELASIQRSQREPRPRDGRRFDWALGTVNENIYHWRLWLYTRAKDGTPRGRFIDWGIR